MFMFCAVAYIYYLCQLICVANKEMLTDIIMNQLTFILWMFIYLFIRYMYTCVDQAAINSLCRVDREMFFGVLFIFICSLFFNFDLI